MHGSETPLSRRHALALTGATFVTSFHSQALAQSASVASFHTSNLKEYPGLKAPIRKLIDTGLTLTQKNLSYRYGSADPGNGGMDCSGTIYHTLQSLGLNPPRSSHTMYLWAQKAGTLRRVSGVHTPNDPKLDAMKPGDLMFWEGTYNVGERNPPISHVMIYVGTSKIDGKGVVFGASSGRRFRGKKIHGVSVFDLSLPSAGSKSKFVAYGRVPGLT